MRQDDICAWMACVSNHAIPVSSLAMPLSLNCRLKCSHCTSSFAAPCRTATSRVPKCKQSQSLTMHACNTSGYSLYAMSSAGFPNAKTSSAEGCQRATMESPQSICVEVKKYLKNTQENPDTPYADVKGSWRKSQKCGCRYCLLACQVVKGDGDGGVVSNEEKKRAMRKHCN
jgi:hypothetical protein